MMACEICKKPYIPAPDDGSFESNEKPHVCNTCGKSFSLKIQLKRHVLSHEENAPYICNTCEKHLEQSSYNLRLSKKGNFTCETCNKCFPSKRLLLRHASEHTLESVIDCEECGEGFRNVTALKKHSAVHKAKKSGPKKSDGRKDVASASEEAGHQCGECSKRFSSVLRLEKHQQTHRHQCDACGTNFKSYYLLKKHRASGTCGDSKTGLLAVLKTEAAAAASVSNESGVGSVENTDASKKHACDICNKSFTRKSALEGHVVTHFTDGRESAVEDDSDIDADFRCNVTPSVDRPPSVEPPPRPQQSLPKLKIRRSYRCEKCDVVCASQKTLDNHMSLHRKREEQDAEERRICRICDETFASKEDYKRHKLSHQQGEDGSAAAAPLPAAERERRTYTCQLCQNVFCKKRHLRKHLKCHFNLDPNETSSLSSEDIQVGKRPKRVKNFACSTCGKRFAGETCLKKHEAKHAEGSSPESSPSKGGGIKREKRPKVLICEFCNEDFSGRKQNFMKHKLSHTPEVCGICDARFVDRAGLREHCRIHIGTEEGRRFIECSQKALDAKNGVAQPEPKVEYIYLVLR